MASEHNPSAERMHQQARLVGWWNLMTKDEARRIAANIAKIPQYRRGGTSL
jgi:hypothetical protein